MCYIVCELTNRMVAMLRCVGPQARPERLYVVAGGKILWRSGLGPFQYDTKGLNGFLAEHWAPSSSPTL